MNAGEPGRCTIGEIPIEIGKSPGRGKRSLVAGPAAVLLTGTLARRARKRAVLQV